MGYWGQLCIACCIYETLAVGVLAETKQLVNTNVCHLCGIYTPKLRTLFLIFQSAAG
jgi:hypothetical protein